MIKGGDTELEKYVAFVGIDSAVVAAYIENSQAGWKTNRTSKLLETEVLVGHETCFFRMNKILIAA